MAGRDTARLPTREQLVEVLDYDSESGALIWRARPGLSKTWNTRFSGKRAGGIALNGYIEVCLNYKFIMAHRIIWVLVHGHWPPEQIDHVNGRRSDNRLLNLRLATPGQNQQNRKIQSNNTTGYKGVSPVRRSGKWKARIRDGHRHIHLGEFNTPEEAAAAYREAAHKLHGEFARFE